MSLINQMLQDLEQRGAGSTDADKMFTSSLNAAKHPTSAMPTVNQIYHAKHGVPYLKISGLIVLLIGGAYLWMQSAPALSQSVGQLKALSFANKPQAPTSAVMPMALPTPQPALNSEQENAPLFESTLTYTPIEAEVQTRKPSLPIENKVTKADENSLVANVMPAKLLAANAPNMNQASKTIDAAKASDITELATLAISTEKVAASTKTNSHSNNNGAVKQMSAEQKSANAYRQALSNLQQGRIAEAQSNLTQALEANSSNQDARQTLAGLLLDNNRKEDAKATLAAGLAIAPEQTGFRIALARLQVDLGDKSGALGTLEQGLPYANNNADYQSFLATLLQRVNRHEEAISHYNSALAINSSAVNSLVGLGISLQALGKFENAQEAYSRAQTSASLSPELAQFIEQQLKQINHRSQNLSQK